MTRQQRWSEKQRALGRCAICGASAGGKWYCMKHRVHQSNRERVKRARGMVYRTTWITQIDKEPYQL